MFERRIHDTTPVRGFCTTMLLLPVVNMYHCCACEYRYWNPICVFAKNMVASISSLGCTFTLSQSQSGLGYSKVIHVCMHVL